MSAQILSVKSAAAKVGMFQASVCPRINLASNRLHLYAPRFLKPIRIALRRIGFLESERGAWIFAQAFSRGMGVA